MLQKIGCKKYSSRNFSMTFSFISFSFLFALVDFLKTCFHLFMGNVDKFLSGKYLLNGFPLTMKFTFHSRKFLRIPEVYNIKFFYFFHFYITLTFSIISSSFLKSFSFLLFSSFVLLLPI